MVDNNLMLSINAAEHYESVLIHAYGPLGRAVLIQQADGQMAITRSGFNILISISNESDSPHQKILMNCVKHFYQTFGDGVKTLVFVVTAILRSLSNFGGVPRILQQLGSVQTRLLQLSVTSGHDTFHYNMIRTFLSTRFSVSVASILGSLLHEWMSVKLRPSIENLLKDFSILCRYQHGSSRSFTDSCVRNGFFIDGHAMNLSTSGPMKLIFFLFDDSDDDHCKFDSLDVKCEMNKFLAKIHIDNEKLIRILVVTPVILSDLILCRLCRENIAVIQGVPIEQVKYLGRVISFESNVVDVIYEKSKERVFLSISTINQLIIYGPTTELCKEYAMASRDALRLLFETEKPYLHNLTVGGGGTWETLLFKHLSFYRAVPCCSSPPSGNREKEPSPNSPPSGNREKVEGIEVLVEISSAFADLDDNILEAILQGIVCVPRKLSQTQAHTQLNEDVIEPLSLRLGILIHALGMVITLIRIDNLISTKKRLSLIVP